VDPGFLVRGTTTIKFVNFTLGALFQNNLFDAADGGCALPAPMKSIYTRLLVYEPGPDLAGGRPLGTTLIGVSRWGGQINSVSRKDS